MISDALPAVTRRFTGSVTVPPKKADSKTARVELLAEPAWVKRMTAVAKSLGLSLAAYIRMSCEEKARRLEGKPVG